MKTYTEVRDITGDIGELFHRQDEVKVPMYSYNRPAYLFWQGFYSGLIKCGATHKQALEILQSKAARHMLDGNGDEVEALGKQLAVRGFKSWITYIED